jgi:hypothetical protein
MFHAEARTIGRTDGETDRHDEGNSRFSQFCEKRLKISVNDELGCMWKDVCGPFKILAV